MDPCSSKPVLFQDQLYLNYTYWLNILNPQIQNLKYSFELHVAAQKVLNFGAFWYPVFGPEMLYLCIINQSMYNPWEPLPRPRRSHFLHWYTTPHCFKGNTLPKTAGNSEIEGQTFQFILQYWSGQTTVVSHITTGKQLGWMFKDLNFRPGPATF